MCRICAPSKGPTVNLPAVVTEAFWLVREYPQAVKTLLASFDGHPLSLVALTEADLPGITAILAKYADLGVLLADASLVHLANREGIDMIFTLDRRDFGVMRLAHGKRIRLVP